METNTLSTPEAQKLWVAPELKKVDIELVTAASASGSDDSFSGLS
jgi:hypothetical protein